MLTSQVLGDSRGCLYEGDLAPLDALVIMPSMMSGPLASDEVKVGMRESQMTKCIHSITSSAAAINPSGNSRPSVLAVLRLIASSKRVS